VKNVQKVLDAETWACQNGLTDRRNSDGQASKCFKSSKKALDRQKQVCETGSTEQTNPGTARRASLKEHYHDCNHQKRPG
jgi:hypothetical protein